MKEVIFGHAKKREDDGLFTPENTLALSRFQTSA